MKTLNNSGTATISQEQIEALSKSASAQIDRAKKFDQEASEGKQSAYVPASVQFFVTIDQNRGSCYGWINYLDGRRLRFYGESRNSVGGPVRMETIHRIPIMILPYEQLAGNQAEYKAHGYGIGSGGELSMTCLKVPVTPYPMELEGDAIISWQTEGSGKFLPA